MIFENSFVDFFVFSNVLIINVLFGELAKPTLYLFYLFIVKKFEERK